MQKIIRTLLIMGCWAQLAFGDAPQETAQFTPPVGWRLADQKALPEHVKVMVVGQGKRDFPPSINLAIDPFSGTLEEYMKVVKSILQSQKAIWKEIGTLDIGSLKGKLLQIDTRTKWGEERQLQLITVYDGAAYILTASALAQEFSDFSADFFAALKSFTINAKREADPAK
jgi:hypothetical protein